MFVCVFSNIVHAASNRDDCVRSLYAEWQQTYCPRLQCLHIHINCLGNDECRIHRANRECLTALIWQRFFPSRRAPRSQNQSFAEFTNSEKTRKREGEKSNAREMHDVGERALERRRQMWGKKRSLSKNSLNPVQLFSGFPHLWGKQGFCWERRSHHY